MTARKCGALHPSLRPSGWECLGVGLSVVMRGPQGVPVVAPTVLLGVLGPAYREVMEREGGPRPFAGGDHLHAILLGPGARDEIRRNNLRLI